MVVNSSEEYPKFAVVGHPNKGKSSLVSSLALDDSVQIGDTPGTTQVKRGFPLQVDGKVVYELFDTPGFQRARRVLDWLKEQGVVRADKRASLVKKFIAKHRNNPKFRDEIELLEPIVNGAGIIYVVDASKPYGLESEVEMEILHWTAKPSMAILNLIGEDDYTKQWKSALSHYFRLVRTFNPIKAKFRDHIELLESMAQLKEEWTKSIKMAIAVLETLHQQKIEDSVNSIVNSIQKSLSFVYKKSIDSKVATKAEQNKARLEYQKQIIKNEKELEKEIEKIWNHKNVEKTEHLLVFDDISLFSKESASIFGLSQKELIVTGASAGALGGFGIDIALGGGTMFLASLIGGAVGGVSAMVGFNNLYEIKVLGKSLGKRELKIGPIKNLNFPYILLGRSLFYASIISNRSHALRNSIDWKESEFSIEKIIDSSMRKRLEKVHIKLRNEQTPQKELLKEYREAILDGFIKLLVKRD